MSRTRFNQATSVVVGLGLLIGCAAGADALMDDRDPGSESSPSVQPGSPDESNGTSQIPSGPQSPRIIVSPIITSPSIQLRCDAASRECFIKNKSTNETISIDGYSITVDNSLVLGQWTSADGDGAGGLQKIPSATTNTLGELQPTGTTVWGPGDARSIGFPFGTGPDFLIRIAKAKFHFTTSPVSPSPVGKTLNAYILGKLPADANNDCIVNRADVAAVVSGLGFAQPGDPADVNFDGTVGLPDLIMVGNLQWNVCVSALVTNTNNDGPGSLRQAVADINAGNAQGITFSMAAGTYAIQLTAPLPPIAIPAAVVRVPAGVQVEVGTASSHAFSSFGMLTKVGPGTLVLAGTQSHAVDATLTVASGELRLNSDAGGNLKLEVIGGSLRFGATQHLASLQITSEGTATMDANGSRVLVTPALSVSGKLDLVDNKLIVKATAETRTAVLAQVAGWLSTGAVSPALTWDGPGINSTAAKNHPTHITALGALLNSNGSIGTFGGQSVTTNDILVKYTYYGDAELSGAVNDTDQNLLTNGLNLGLTGWFNGDFNHDGAINAADTALFNTARTNQGSPL